MTGDSTNSASSKEDGLTGAVQEAGAVELLLIRHGESEGNVAATEARAAGVEVIEVPARDADVDLSGTGKEQATALGKALARIAEEFRPDAVVSSPYARARQTAEIAVDTAGWPLKVRTDERLRDRELGILDRLTRLGVENRYPGESERRDWLGKFYYRPPGGESWVDVALRLRSVLAELNSLGMGHRVMLVCHDAVIMLFRYVLEGLSEQELLDLAAREAILNASVTRFVRPSGAGPWTLESFNVADHLTEFGATVTEHAGDTRVQPK
ncbi:MULTISPECIES: histidine phosphatase family protein [unclassified Arthrobacter]|uniref:histidine phosphatase family protein n=1 Tax=unclassified Arthrobacter TaxID=235627 RepID=UPI001C844434|nr:histidine phosphatase family protein [Arthrobacter sp. MAHUQ-56]MBX7444820.1 histidine phosphatase family protein [Arthrobacter sp. MAHUQ-56]